jgi:hypothetical protein
VNSLLNTVWREYDGYATQSRKPAPHGRRAKSSKDHPTGTKKASGGKTAEGMRMP